jgi:hypothetical protein
MFYQIILKSGEKEKKNCVNKISEILCTKKNKQTNKKKKKGYKNVYYCV